jgi:tRNA dimethylallyltransferase
MAADRGREYIHRVLKRLDLETAGRIAPRDKPKVIRAIEVRLATGRRLSEHLEREPKTPLVGFNFTLIGLDPARHALYDRINQRVVDMWDNGLADEVRGLLTSGAAPTSKAFEAIGYRHVLDYLDGKMARDEAIMLMQRDTRRYAKRQLSWFKRQQSVHWFDGFGNDEKIRKRVHRFVQRTLSVHSGPLGQAASRS